MPADMKARRFSITNQESSAVEAGLSLLKAELNNIESEEGYLSEYWKWIREMACDLLSRLSKYQWFK